MTERWARDRMRFRFRLGETTLFARWMDVAVHQGRFIDRGSEVDALEIPREGPFGVAAYVALSHPVDGTIAPVKVLPDALRLATHQYRRSFIPIEGAFDEYLKKLPSSRRNQIKRKVKKYRERSGGTLDFRV